MALLPFRKKTEAVVTTDPMVVDFLQDFSIEVMPRTANFEAV